MLAGPTLFSVADDVQRAERASRKGPDGPGFGSWSGHLWKGGEDGSRYPDQGRTRRTLAGVGAGDIESEHAIYAEDAILDYPQSGERFRGRATISAQRGGHPADRHFTVHRIVGFGDLWVSECVITYDGVPTYSVSVMEFAHGQVVHETQYFADAFGAPDWRRALAEPMPGRNIARD